MASGYQLVVVLGLFCFLSFFSQQTLAGQPASIAVPSVGTALFSGIAVDPTSDALFVCDKVGNRVLRFDNRQSLTSASTHSLAIGQSTLTGTSPNNGGTVGAVGLYNPFGATVDSSGRLWVSDTVNRRVVCYKNASSLSSGATAASIVLGQASFTSNQPAVTATGMHTPNGLRASDTDLWVTDYNVSRVIRFANILSLVSFQAATSVIGKPDFTSQGFGTPVTAFNLNGATEALPTSAGLLVASSTANRVTFYPTLVQNNNGPAAAFAYGQLDLASSTARSNAIGLNTPTGLAVGYDGTLFVSDKNNHRITIYSPVPPIANGIAAVDVLGQPNLNSASPGSGLSNLRSPTLITYDDKYNALWVSDSSNFRILRFDNILPKVTPVVTQNGTQQVAFVGRTPNAVLSPANDTNVLVSPGRIDELNAAGNVVATHPLPSYGYSLSSSVDANQTQNFHFVTVIAGATVTLDYALYAQTVPLSSAGVSFSVGPGVLKLSLSIENWSFALASNTLKVHFALNVEPAVTSIQTNTSTSTNITSFTVESSASVTTVRLLPYGIVDNTSTVPVTFGLTVGSSTVANSTLDLVLDVPHFSTSFSYDPDFSVKAVAAGNTNVSPASRLRNWMQLVENMRLLL